MALAIKDMVKGTIVDHTFEYHANERELALRPVRRRGIIVKVDGVANDAVTAVYVQFRPDKEPEKVAPRELVRVLPWNSKPARRALARITGQQETVGAEFQERLAPVRPRAEDSLALTPRRGQAVVEPENDEIDPMIESQTPPVMGPAEDTTE